MKLSTQLGIASAALFAALALPAKTLAQGSPAAQPGNFEQTHYVKLFFSGTSENSATNLQQTNTSNDEDIFAGKGRLGSFTVRLLRAISNTPSQSSTCAGANHIYFEELAGGGVFRFHDSSLLYVNLTRGHDCIDLATGTAHCTLTFEITGGTRRFEHAQGGLTMTETVSTVLSDALKNPVFFAATGEFTGIVSGVGPEVVAEEARPDDQQ